MGGDMKLSAIMVAACAAFTVAGAVQAQPKDRVAAWREDIAVARSEFLVKDLSFTPAARRRAAADLDRLARRADRLSDAEISGGLARAAARAGNAHTRAYLLRNRGVWRRYPIRIWKFADGWRVVAARPDQAPLVGARVLQVAGHPVDAAAGRMRPLFAGNESWADYMATYTLTSPDALIGSGLMKGDGAAAFALEIDGRRTVVRLEPEPLVRREGPEESWWFLSPAHPAAKGWVLALPGANATPPLAGAAENYRFVRCAGDVAYLQFNRAQNAGHGDGVAAFGERVMAELAARPPRKLVVDLRFNTGGDLSLGAPFFKALAAAPVAQTPGATAVVVGPMTFSAAITHVVQMRAGSRAVLVGSPPGDGLEFWAEGGNVLLPNSRINLHYADKAHSYSPGPSRVPKSRLYLDLDVASLKPDVPARWTWAAYLAGRDGATEAFLGAPLACP
jgi:hypothetical protein